MNSIMNTKETTRMQINGLFLTRPFIVLPKLTFGFAVSGPHNTFSC